MNFSKESIILVLQYLKELRQGENIEQNLSYLERPLATRIRSLHAPFENSCLLVAEVENRLAKCGRDGFFCKVYYALDEREESIARAFGLPVKTVSKGIKSALAYVSYKWPKDRSYYEFKSHRKAKFERR